MDDADHGFRAFYSDQHAALRSFAFLLSGDWSEAEELAQESMVRTLRAWGRIRGPEQAVAYARRTLVNRYRSLLRRAMTQLRHRHLFAGPHGEPPPDDRLVLVRALRRLPVRQRAVLVLRHFEDLPESEVARVLGLPLGTVKSLNRRGLALLRQAPDVVAMLPSTTEVIVTEMRSPGA